MHINQLAQLSQVLSEIETRYNLVECENLPNAEFNIDDDSDPVNIKEYQSFVGTLLWFSRMSRPDIYFLVAKAATVSQKPKQNHKNILLATFGYLKSTRTLDMKYTKSLDNKMHLTVYSDASYGEESGHNTTGWLTFINGTALNWKSKKQATVAISATESETIAAYDAGLEAFFTLKLLDDFDNRQTRISHFIDNQSAIHNFNQDNVGRVKKVMYTKYNKMREFVKRNILFPMYINTADNPADFFTKSNKQVQNISHIGYNSLQIKFRDTMKWITGYKYSPEKFNDLVNSSNEKLISSSNNINSIEDLLIQRELDKQQNMNPYNGDLMVDSVDV